MPPVIVALALAAPATASASGPLGSLTQLSGAAGCVSTGGADGAGGTTCTAGSNLVGADAPVVSPDGKSVYVGIYGWSGTTPPPDTLGGIAVFSRNPATGTITQLPGKAGCITADGSSDAGPNNCTNGRAVDSPDGQPPAISSDGRFLYYASQGVGAGTGSVDIFSRDPGTSALTQLGGTAGCFSQDGSSEEGAGTCGVAPSLDGPVTPVLSPDGRFLYVVSYDNTAPYHTTYPGITIFARDAMTGALTLLPGATGCLTYAAYSAAGAGTCGTLHGFGSGSGEGFAISPDGRFAYATEYNDGDGDVLLFSRNPNTGQLTQLAGTAGCLSDDGNSSSGAGTCTKVHSIDGAWQLALSPDGKFLVVGAYQRGLAVFRRDAQTGLLTQLPGTAGCLSDNGASSDPSQPCTDVKISKDVYGLVFGPDGRTLIEVSYLDTFATSASGLSIYSFDPSTGVLTQLPGTAGCVTNTGASDDGPGTCAVARGVNGAYGLALSPDGAYAYAAGYHDNAVAVFSRSAAPICTSLSAAVPFFLPTVLKLSCQDPNNDPFSYAIVNGPAHGKVTAPTATGMVTFTPTLGFTGADSFTFEATGAKGPSAAATFGLTVKAPSAASLKLGAASVKGHTLSVHLSCLSSGAACHGTLTVTAKLSGKGHKLRTQKIASHTFSVAAGQSTIVGLSLSGASRSALRQHSLGVTITAAVAQPNHRTLTVTKKLTLKRQRTGR
jgi:6-phosphogluconolactonase (cycloisomerase 2 family)